MSAYWLKRPASHRGEWPSTECCGRQEVPHKSDSSVTFFQMPCYLLNCPSRHDGWPFMLVPVRPDQPQPSITILVLYPQSTCPNDWPPTWATISRLQLHCPSTDCGGRQEIPRQFLQERQLATFFQLPCYLLNCPSRQEASCRCQSRWPVVREKVDCGDSTRGCNAGWGLVGRNRDKHMVMLICGERVCKPPG